MFNFNNLLPEAFYIGKNYADITWGKFELIWDPKAFIGLGKLKPRVIRNYSLRGPDSNSARFILSEWEFQWGAGHQLLVSYPSIFWRRAGSKALEIRTDK